LIEQEKTDLKRRIEFLKNRKLHRENLEQKLSEEELEKLKTVKGIDEVAIFLHDRPDPDAMGSALLLSYILQQEGVDSQIIYSGDIQNYQNKQLLTDLDLSSLMKKTGNIAKSTKYSGLEDYLSSVRFSVILDTEDITKQISHYKLLNPAVIIDHHISSNGKTTKKGSKKSDEKGPLVIKKHTGANVTILLNYMKDENYDLSGDDNIALRITSYFGMKTDTGGFDPQKMTKADREAKEYLELFMTDSDFKKLDNIENPTLPKETRAIYHKASLDIIEGRVELIDDRLILYEIPEIIKDTNLVPFLAEALYKERKQNKAEAVIVYGLVDSEEDGERKIQVMASGRSNDLSLDVREVFQDTFYHSMPGDGKHFQFSGGRKSGESSTTAGATGMMWDYLEMDPDHIALDWSSKSRLYRNRINKYNQRESQRINK
jgi:nanoRNase/pAp phosphatase (c-di-AMP/oligoRNAs hydrolase)